MRTLFDNPILNFFSKLFDLAILNLLTIVCCLPVVTMGASITAAHYTALKIRRNEGHVISNFFSSFKENFKQSTVIWFMFCIHSAVAIVAWILARNIGGILSTLMMGVIAILLIFTLLGYMWIFPLQSKFINPISITVKNSFLLAFRYLFSTLYMVAMYLIPLMLMCLIPMKWYIVFFLLVGVSAPFYWCSMRYDKLFEQLEEEI